MEDHPADGDRLLASDAVANLIAVPESWVRAAARSGILPCVRIGRYVRFRRADILAWVEDQRR